MNTAELMTGLHKLWLELTVGCNLRCRHCYSDSGPSQFKRDKLAHEDYIRIIHEAHELDCQDIRFIGGEPTLNRNLSHYIKLAVNLNYDIQLFSNLTQISPELYDVLVKSNVKIKVPIFSDQENIHDNITNTEGSFKRTIENVERLVDKVPIVASILLMPENVDHIPQIKYFLQKKGINNISTDRVRGVGRGKMCAGKEGIDELCHHCWMGSIAVGSDGTVYPCTIGRNFPVGDIYNSSLNEIVFGEKLKSFREISRTKYDEKIKSCCPGPFTPCRPNQCNPDDYCTPDDCSPDK